MVVFYFCYERKINMRQEEIAEKIKEKVSELNGLFENAASFFIKFDCHFDQSQSFGKGKVAHLTLDAYKNILPLTTNDKLRRGRYPSP